MKPLDFSLIAELVKDHRLLVTMEENVHNGGFGEQVTAWVKEQRMEADVLNVSIPDTFVEHGGVEQLRKKLGLDEENILRRIQDWQEEQQE